MKSNRISTTSMMTRVSLALLAAAPFVAGCSHPAEEPAHGETSAPVASDGCVQFEGFEHCPLGRATLEVKEGALDVTNMAAAGVDGVSIHLRDVTEWIPDGHASSERGGLRLLARSIADGVSTSTLTIDEDEETAEAGEMMTRYSIHAAFTGSGERTTYSVVVYMGDTAVGAASIRPWPPQDGVLVAGPRPIRIPHFHVVRRPSVIPMADRSSIRVNEGACQFTLPSGGEAMVVTLPDGRRFEGDRLEFIETVPASGSYPYHSFDGMEYTAAGGHLTFARESAR